MKNRLGKRGRLALRVCLPLLALALLAALWPNLAVLLGTRKSIVEPEEISPGWGDCILVLGAGLLPDGSPSLMLAERIRTGTELYARGAAPKLLMSGDHTRPEYDEVNAMKDAALAAGVPSADVFMDHAGVNTYNSMYRAKSIFGAKRVIVVTQAYHLSRALYIAKRLGLEAVGVACDTRRYAGQFNRDVREALARIKDYCQCFRLPPSAYGGEAIPLSGSGDVTNDRA